VKEGLVNRYKDRVSELAADILDLEKKTERSVVEINNKIQSVEEILYYYNCTLIHKRILGEQGRGAHDPAPLPPPIFFLPKNHFLANELNGDKQKIEVIVGEKG